jgi:3D (Asp-Asp-Asp) domain-containing protein
VIALVRWLPAVLVVLSTGACATVVAPQATPAPAAAPDAGPVVPVAHGTRNVYVTFYGGPDNDPPGSTDIAYPNGRHGTAGGVGTDADPITLATDPRELPPGTLVYVPRLKKYFVMEDDCEDCIAEWGANRRPHVDLWTAAAGARLPACEEALTPDAPVPLEINPPADRPVDPRPLYDPAADRCLSGGP